MKIKLRQLKLDKEEREQRRIGWKEIGEACGVSVQALANITSPKGMTPTCSKFLERFCWYFECRIEDMVEVEEPPEKFGTTPWKEFESELPYPIRGGKGALDS